MSCGHLAFRRIQWAPKFLSLLILLFAAGSPILASPLAPGQGVTFQQVGFDYTGLSTVPFSQYGQMFANYSTLAGAGFGSGYINVVTAAGWAVQNLPVAAASGYAGLSVMFDLGASANGVSQTGISAYVDFSATPLSSAPAGSPQSFNNANGSFNTSLMTNAQGDGANRPANPGAPAANGGISFDIASLLTSLTLQLGHTSVEQDDNQCGPASLANSLDYLRNRYGITVPQTNIPGIAGQPPGSLVGQIDNKMTRPQGQAISNNQFITGKLNYLSDSKITGLSIKHEGGDGAIGTGDVTAGGLTSKFAGKVTADWIISELQHGEDVEMNIRWTGCATAPNCGGHWVDLIGGGFILGRPWVAFVHDYKQGFDAANNKTAINGGTGLFDGGVGFSFLDTDVNGNVFFRNWVDGSTARVNFVVSESLPEPATAMLAFAGLLLLGAGLVRRRR